MLISTQVNIVHASVSKQIDRAFSYLKRLSLRSSRWRYQ
jgi:hypothetical protein